MDGEAFRRSFRTTNPFFGAVIESSAQHIADITLSYIEGRPVPRVDYTDLENTVWSNVCDRIRPFHERIA